MNTRLKLYCIKIRQDGFFHVPDKYLYLTLFPMFLFSAALIAQTGASIVIDSSGQVGMGKNSPTASLHINGRIKDSSGYVFPVHGIIMYAGAETDFDESGIGKKGTTVEGWALCDGKDGRPELKKPIRRETMPPYWMYDQYNDHPELLKNIISTVITNPTGSVMRWTNFKNTPLYIIKL
jgi:hypothetical protein